MGIFLSSLRQNSYIKPIIAEIWSHLELKSPIDNESGSQEKILAINSIYFNTNLIHSGMSKIVHILMTFLDIFFFETICILIQEPLKIAP